MLSLAKPHVTVIKLPQPSLVLSIYLPLAALDLISQTRFDISDASYLTLCCGIYKLYNGAVHHFFLCH